MIKNLWAQRERPAVFSKRWFKVCLKRAFYVPELINLSLRKKRLSIKGADIGGATVIENATFIGNHSNLKIGDCSYVGNNVHIALHSNISIGNRVVLNANVILLSGTHDINDSAWGLVSKPIFINDYAWVATGAIILPGVTVGEGAVIGAGSVVSRDVPPYSVTAGNPAKVIGARNNILNYNPVALVSAFEAWVGHTSTRNK